MHDFLRKGMGIGVTWRRSIGSGILYVVSFLLYTALVSVSHIDLPRVLRVMGHIVQV